MPVVPELSFKRLIAPILLIAALLLIRFEWGMLLFHTLAELFSIIVGILMLVIAWNTRRFTHNDFLLYLGIGYFWIAILDGWHTFTVAGLPFFHFNDAEVTLHFWIYTRFLEALLLLTAPWMLRHKLNVNAMLYGGGLLALLVVWASMNLTSPVMLTDQGLSPFKVNMEYLIMAMLLAAFIVYRRQRQLLADDVRNYLMISVLLTLFAEFFFTQYRDFHGIPFVIGHIFKFLSFWMVYQAIVRTTLAKPFALLASHSTSYNAIPHAAVVVDEDGAISQLNVAAELLTHQSADALLHQPVHEAFHNRSVSIDQCELCLAIAQGRELEGSELYLAQLDRWFLVSLSLIQQGGKRRGMVQTLTDITTQKRVLKTLETQEQWLRQVLRTLPYGVQENDLHGVITYANEALHEIHGLPQGALVGRNIWDFEVTEEKKQQVREYLQYLVAQQPAPTPFVSENINLQGDDCKTLEVIWDYQRDNQGELRGFVSVVSDISERKQAESALRHSEERFQDFAETAADLFWEMDENLRFSYVSGKVEKLMGCSADSIIGKTRAALYKGQAIAREPWFQLHLHTIKQHRPFVNLEIPWDINGELRYMQVSGKPLFDDQGCFLGYRGVTRDISEKKRTEQKIVQQAHFDSLTRLPNRFLSLDRLTQRLNEAQRSRHQVAVIFLDLDDFKKVNDSLGHEIGDKLLVEAAQRLQHVVRKGDTVGRLGGDEFIILLGGLASAADALPITENLLNRLRDSFHIEGRELILSGSIGIALYPQDGDTPSELLRNADSAMYHAKEMGRNTYSFFTEEMNQQVSRRLEIEEQIHGALGRGEFEVYYQPKIDVGSRKLIGAEALLRWNNPALGSVSPMEFIPIAEQTGLIIPIGQFVLYEALEACKRWRSALFGDFCMAVNLSPRQFRDPELVTNVQGAINASGVPAQALELEITEGVLMSGHAYIDEALAGIKALGVSLAMDDFGTGYSSLSYLRNYPFDILKIDQSFVRDISDDPADRELINAAIAMAHSLHLKVVAEGVETEVQLHYLQQLDCDYLQGYLFGKPMTMDVFEQKYSRIPA